MTGWGQTGPYAKAAGHEVKTGKFPGISVVGKAPFDTDYVSLFTNREEYGLINYLNLFINQQVRTGRYAEVVSTLCALGAVPFAEKVQFYNQRKKRLNYNGPYVSPVGERSPRSSA